MLLSAKSGLYSRSPLLATRKCPYISRVALVTSCCHRQSCLPVQTVQILAPKKVAFLLLEIPSIQNLSTTPRPHNPLENSTVLYGKSWNCFSSFFGSIEARDGNAAIAGGRNTSSETPMRPAGRPKWCQWGW